MFQLIKNGNAVKSFANRGAMFEEAKKYSNEKDLSCGCDNMNHSNESAARKNHGKRILAMNKKLKKILKS